MKKVFLLVLWSLVLTTSFAQNVSASLENAWRRFMADPQLQQAMASLYVADANNGQVVFAQNEAIGLAPASTQKLLTSATAYALLGADFRYRTRFGLVPSGSGHSLVVVPSGDPTLGSWRWSSTREEALLRRLTGALQKSGATGIHNIAIYNKGWQDEAIPNGWIWEDLGNYFGAGAFGLNWRENQYDVLLHSGANIGDAVSIAGTVPRLYGFSLQSRVRAAAKGSGDQTLIYLPVLSEEGVIRGTIPAGEQRFKVSGAFPNPPHQFAETIKAYTGKLISWEPDAPAMLLEDHPVLAEAFHTEISPGLDSIVYWLNQKSINLYAEALVKSIAAIKGKPAAADAGIEQLKSFWKQQGIAATELNVQDGSGLSPQNRVTTRAQVAVLLYARKQPWFNGFQASLPLYNGMKMKSGTIGGVKGFTGYHTSKSGTTYAFSFLVNNYNGGSSALVQKMYAVLDALK